MRTRRTHLLLATTATAALTLAAVALPLLGGRAAATDRVVTVAAGQTLSQIALEEGLSVDALASMNGISDPNRIFIGQRLVIRSQPPAPSPAGQGTASHRVAAGETLSAIAVQYGTSVSAIAQANAIPNASYIRVGQVLTIPGATAPVSAPPATVTHRVAAGETLWGIAVLYRTSVESIARANGIADASYIRAGQVLTIPGGSDPADAPSGDAPAGRSMPAAMAGIVAQRADVARLIGAEAQRQGVPVAFALAVAWQESGWQPGVVSSAGAIGVMQLLPATGDWVATAMLGHGVNLWDPGSNVEAGVALLKHYLDRYGDRSLALAAYYQGQTAVDHHGIYAVTRPYVASILELERIFAG